MARGFGEIDTVGHSVCLERLSVFSGCEVGVCTKMLRKPGEGEGGCVTGLEAGGPLLGQKDRWQPRIRGSFEARVGQEIPDVKQRCS